MKVALDSLHSDYFRVLCAAMGWDEKKPFQVCVMAELSPEYPMIRYEFQNCTVVGIAGFIEETQNQLESELEGLTMAEIAEAVWEGVAWTIDASAISVLAPGMMVPKCKGVARPLDENDHTALKHLRRAVGPKDWQRGEVSLSDEQIVGVLDGQMLAAAAGSVLWSDALADVSAITHPSRRKKGHAAEAVACLCRHHLAKGQWVQWRYETDNAASRALANRVGFLDVARVEGLMVTYPDEA